MSTTQHEVRYLDRINMTLPTNPATRKLGLAGKPCEVTVGEFHARLHLDGGIIRRIKLHEAGIIGDPTTGGLYIAEPTSPNAASTLAASAPAMMRTNQLLDALRGCEPYASVVLERSFATGRAPHGVSRVAQQQSLVLLRGSELHFNAKAGNVSPTSATVRVRDLSAFVAAGDTSAPVVVMTDSRDSVQSITGVALTNSRVVWLIAGPAIKTPGRIMSRLMAGLHSQS